MSYKIRPAQHNAKLAPIRFLLDNMELQPTTHNTFSVISVR